MSLDLGHLEGALADAAPFGRWIYLEDVDSTMDVARARAEAGAPEGTLVLAGAQQRGRGRRGRDWTSPRGGIWLSLVLRPRIAQDRVGCFSILLALAIAEALRDRYGLSVRVKWPNDLLIGRKKLGGVLIELATVSTRVDWLIAGIGLNVNNPLPQDARVPPTSLRHALGHPVSLEETISVIVRAVARRYAQFQREGFAPVRAQWGALSALGVGERVWVERNGERFEALVRGLSEGGELLVERDHRLEALVVGDVTLSLGG